MKKLNSLLLLLLIPSIALGECDFSTGITKLPEGNFQYTKECHIAVGNLVQSNATKDKQIADLNQAIDLKNLAISKSDERIVLWRDSTFKLEDRINTISSLQSSSNWLYFGLGAITVMGAGFMVGKLFHP